MMDVRTTEFARFQTQLGRWGEREVVGRESGRRAAKAITCSSVVRRGRRSGRPHSLSAVATWLILPVVICLSQRLSHACLSTNFYTVKLRMAH